MSSSKGLIPSAADVELLPPEITICESSTSTGD